MPAPKTELNGYEVFARMLALEGFVMVLLEGHLDRPEIDAISAKELLLKMTASAKALAAEMNHVLLQAEVAKYADLLSETLLEKVAAMRDGKPG